MKRRRSQKTTSFRNNFAPVVGRDGKWFIAFSPEVPGANGQGRTKAACLKSLAKAVKLLLDIQKEEVARDVRR